MFFNDCKGAIEVFKPETLDVFFNMIAPFSNHWSNEYSHWVFRGQGNSDWPLLPSLFRRNYWNDRFGEESQPSWKTLLNDEIRNLQKFVKYSDYVGLRIPGDSVAIREYTIIRDNIPEYIKEKDCIEPSNWPLRELILPLALCQHSGIPTVLLDWTNNAFNAVYFACENQDSEEEAVIWCLNRYQLEYIYKCYYDDHSQYGIYVIDPPRFDNTFMKAQSGLFTIQSYGDISINKTAKPESLEDRILLLDNIIDNDSIFTDGNISLNINTIECYDPLLIKICINSSFKREIMTRLKSIRINRSSIYPSYFDVAKYIRYHDDD